MGQQQLLLIVLGIILVAVALVVGISLFRENAVDQKRHNLINECINLAAMAQQYFLKPTTYGGGGQSFTNWQIPNELRTTANGSYKIITQTAAEVVVLGTGNEVVTGTDSVKVKITIPSPPNTYLVQPLN
ncbi:MAG: hypothetical protein CVV23_01450 [Ignavibacteriae bacterium HGW-Ignavibacteriae-2]|jgi:hypothetical protein|nr:hypothetical protein [Bacteroidota bacterium]PKL90033.1 MAG: hypothetical protein CVV23_01450 [Ignavibacteriae bacterium HGW-Ignavibacteriae-2]